MLKKYKKLHMDATQIKTKTFVRCNLSEQKKLKFSTDASFNVSVKKAFKECLKVSERFRTFHTQTTVFNSLPFWN